MKAKRKTTRNNTRKPPRRSSIFLKAAREEDAKIGKIRHGTLQKLREKLNEKDKEIERLKTQLKRRARK
jgi:hypothetical protein